MEFLFAYSVTFTIDGEYDSYNVLAGSIEDAVAMSEQLLGYIDNDSHDREIVAISKGIKVFTGVDYKLPEIELTGILDGGFKGIDSVREEREEGV